MMFDFECLSAAAILRFVETHKRDIYIFSSFSSLLFCFFFFVDALKLCVFNEWIVMRKAKNANDWRRLSIIAKVNKREPAETTATPHTQRQRTINESTHNRRRKWYNKKRLLFPRQLQSINVEHNCHRRVKNWLKHWASSLNWWVRRTRHRVFCKHTQKKKQNAI